MQYAAAIFGGVAASAIFWLIDKYLLTLPQSYQIGGVIGCFVVFGALGFYLAMRVRARQRIPAGTRVASGLKARNVKVAVDGVRTTGAGNAEIVTDIDATGDVDAKVKNVEAGP